MKKIDKKIKKLIKHPKLFFTDMYIKYKGKVNKRASIKYSGKNNFTIIAAVYNVEKYLDEFFISIINQSLKFKQHIQIICVDDGSTDNSKNIIFKWKKKYPNNIQYIYKENGGQASARNVGLNHVKTDWVTFIDPDDFISADYFYKIDNYLGNKTDIALVGCPLIFYFEDKNIFKDTHPLKYRFAKGTQTLGVSNLENYLQLSASTAIFKMPEISKHNILFDEKMKPSFEDAKFVTDYILNIDKSYKVGFLSGISYFYRKRDDGSSTLDSAWRNPLLFSRVLEKGCIQILKDAKNKLGTAPEHIQRVALYHIIWYFGRIVNNPSSVSHLTDQEKEKFISFLFEMFNFIDEKTILRFNLAGVWWYQKVALLGLFKKVSPPSQIAYIEDFDVKRNQVLIRHFSNFNHIESYLLDKKDTIPSYQKEIRHDFLGHLYTKEYRTWIYVDNAKELSFSLNQKAVKLTFLGKQYDKLNINSIREHFLKKSTVKNDTWIFIDRDNQADDNAEHLYRYVQKIAPEQKIFFALKKNSYDWNRLKRDGFNLLDFGSSSFEKELRECSKIISSHIDGYITHYFKDNSLLDKDYVFLQHGITKDNLSSWLNTKKINLFVTATKDEYSSIVGNSTSYKFGEKEVKLTGFPRYDALLKGNKKNNKQILIMPTWRSSIVGEYIEGTQRKRNPDFMKTNYAIHWHHFLNNGQLGLLAKLGYQIIFSPHPSIQEYMDEFILPDYISIYKYSEGNIQKLFQESDILITDYSSVAFDCAYLNKAILYYQFDFDEVFDEGIHTYKQGYFNYIRDGFGPVAYNELDLIDNLTNIIQNNGRPDKIYLDRINETFPFKDENNCCRVYRKIKELDTLDSNIDHNLLIRYINTAFSNKQWELLENRSKLLLSYDNKNDHSFASNMLATALISLKKFDEALDILEKYDFEENISKDFRLSISIANREWKTIQSILISKSKLSINEKCNLLYSFIVQEQYEKFNTYLVSLDLKNSSKEIEILVSLWILLVNKDWEGIIHYDEKIEHLPKDYIRLYKLKLILVKAYRKLGKYKEAEVILSSIENSSEDLEDINIESANLAFYQGNYIGVITKLDNVFKGNILLMNKELIKKYLYSHLEKLNLDSIVDISSLSNNLELALENYPEDEDLILINLNFSFKVKKWLDVIDSFKKIPSLKNELLYKVALSYYRLGLFEELKNFYITPSYIHSYDYWKLIAEFALIIEDYDLLGHCYKGMIAIYPDISKQETLDLYNKFILRRNINQQE